MTVDEFDVARKSLKCILVLLSNGLNIAATDAEYERADNAKWDKIQQNHPVQVYLHNLDCLEVKFVLILTLVTHFFTPAVFYSFESDNQSCNNSNWTCYVKHIPHVKYSFKKTFS